ncbi:hypothetical protein TrRE_jg1139, partial [Triparma retinervis]
MSNETIVDTEVFMEYVEAVFTPVVDFIDVRVHGTGPTLEDESAHVVVSDLSLVDVDGSESIEVYVVVKDTSGLVNVGSNSHSHPDSDSDSDAYSYSYSYSSTEDSASNAGYLAQKATISDNEIFIDGVFVGFFNTSIPGVSESKPFSDSSAEYLVYQIPVDDMNEIDLIFEAAKDFSGLVDAVIYYKITDDAPSLEGTSASPRMEKSATVPFSISFLPVAEDFDLSFNDQMIGEGEQVFIDTTTFMSGDADGSEKHQLYFGISEDRESVSVFTLDDVEIHPMHKHDFNIIGEGFQTPGMSMYNLTVSGGGFIEGVYIKAREYFSGPI